MGRTKSKAKRATKQPAPLAEPTPPTTYYTVPELLLQAAQHVASCSYEEAKAVSQAAVQVAQEGNDAKGLTDSLEILGTVELELGELDTAREHFLLSIQHASALPDPSPAPHLYLAQLSTPEESLTHFTNALTILQAKLAVIERSKLGLDGNAGSGLDFEEESELRRSASRALVGMTELYLTDLCFETDAEATCERHLALAGSIDPSDPEVYQTLASVRLSQERPNEAKEAALRGWSLWRHLGPDSMEYPPSATRLSLAKLLLEMTLHSSALEILQRLENENDEDAEVLYLSGWAWWLLGEKRPPGEAGETEEESREECWSESKLCLENYLKLDEREPEGSDPEQLAHVREIMAKLDAAGVVASEGHQEGVNEWEDESDGEADVEMAS